MFNDRLRRITDLFVEGTELFFGLDEKNEPILLWVAKLNSFEEEEARRDAAVKRGMRVAELSKDDNPELVSIMTTIDKWSDDTLAQARVDQRAQEITLNVFNDIEADEDWRDKVEMVRRGDTLLDDEGAADDDPRRLELTSVRADYVNEIRKRQEKAKLDYLRDMKTEARSTLVEEFIESWRNRETMDLFMQERRITEIFYAVRDCKGKRTQERDGKYEFDHSGCDHTGRMMTERREVYNLPENVIERIVDAIDGVTVPIREAGNSDAPASSSASSGLQSEEEESTPSIPAETSPGAATT